MPFVKSMRDRKRTTPRALRTNDQRYDPRQYECRDQGLDECHDCA